MIAVLAAAAVGLVSAFVPFTPAEPYLIAAVATTGAAPLALGLAAGAGQSAGKVLIFLAARGVLHAPWWQRRLGRRPRTGRFALLGAVLDRPRPATGVLLVSGITGVPPLLAVTVYLGRTPMRLAVFAVTCLVGRTIRFVAIALAPRLVGWTG